MSLPKEYIDELNILNKKVSQDQPDDVIKYCANHFSNRLAERKNQSLFNNQTSGNTASNGISDDDPVSSVSNPTANKAPTLFKNSFTNEIVNNNNNNSIMKPPGASASASDKNSYHPENFVPLRRSSVSAESLNPKNFKDDHWKPPHHELSADQLARLNSFIVKNFLFSNLDDEDALNTVLHALTEEKYPEGSNVINQGDEGEYFYLIESGEVEFYVNNKLVGSNGTGSSFGELALMYNSPRAASVKAKTDLIVWALDRLTFRRILLEVTAKKRIMYEAFLKDVSILKDLNSYQRSKLADALNTEVYNPGQVIIQQGDIGENFYLIVSGEADVIKNEEGKVGTIGKGGYFGEIALLNDLPRQASIKATTLVKVATLGKSGFQRLLGPVVEVLKAQDPRIQR